MRSEGEGGCAKCRSNKRRVHRRGQRRGHGPVEEQQCLAGPVQQCACKAVTLPHFIGHLELSRNAPTNQVRRKSILVGHCIFHTSHRLVGYCTARLECRTCTTFAFSRRTAARGVPSATSAHTPRPRRPACYSRPHPSTPSPICTHIGHSPHRYTPPSRTQLPLQHMFAPASLPVTPNLHVTPPAILSCTRARHHPPTPPAVTAAYLIIRTPTPYHY